MQVPELSIVVPVLNEAETLPRFLGMLSAQREIAFEVVFSDGGSTDGTPAELKEYARRAPFPVRLVEGGKGRGRQLNAGAAAARGETLLFLHVDSEFTDPFALQGGLAALDAGNAARGDDRVAGRFALRFQRTDDTPSLGYAYYETKARLDRSGCTHGDQGFLLRRSFLQEVGPFDESLPVLEDTLFAEEVRRKGEWLLLPAEIHTSARRFEVEGLRSRQALNALLMNFANIGWGAFFDAVPDIYQQQGRTGRLQLYPFLAGIRDLLRPLPGRERLRLWYATGCYVRKNAWQLLLAMEVRRSFPGGQPVKSITRKLARFDLRFDRLTDHVPGRLLTAVLVWIWFRFALFHLGRREEPGGRPSRRGGPGGGP